jgi:Rho family protein
MLTPSPQWYPEISHFTPHTPTLLVGTKIDTRHSQTELSLMRTQGQAPVTPEEGAAVAREIGAKAYLECSAMTGEGVARVFEEAWRVCARTGMGVRKRGQGEKRKCVVL